MAKRTAPNQDLGAANGLQGSSYLYDYGTTPNTRTAVSQKVRILTPGYGDNDAMTQMGVVSSFNPSQSRTVEPVRGIGFGDMVAELVPSVTEPTTGSFERALLYLCNLWQATGYAGGIDGPVRSLAHHRWPFDIEQQLVFSSLADSDSGKGNQGNSPSGFGAGTRDIKYPSVTPSWENDGTTQGSNPTDTFRGHSAIITIYEACWFTSWSATFAKDAGMIMETGDVTVSDVHDFSSQYGEFLATGNDPTVGQLGSVRYYKETAFSKQAETGNFGVGAGSDITGNPAASGAAAFAAVEGNTGL